MDENVQDILNKIKSLNIDGINTESINQDTIKNLLESFSNNQNSSSTSNSTSDIPDIDIDMLFKLKSIMSQLNSNEDDPRSNLLLSLKPYLRNDRKDKIDQYIKFLKLGKVIELLKPLNGGDKDNGTK